MEEIHDMCLYMYMTTSSSSDTTCEIRGSAASCVLQVWVGEKNEWTDKLPTHTSGLHKNKQQI